MLTCLACLATKTHYIDFAYYAAIRYLLNKRKAVVDYPMYLSIERNYPYPFGAYWSDNALHFSLHAKDAKEVTLCLSTYDSNRLEPIPLAMAPLDPFVHKTGSTWHAAVVTPLPEVVFYYYQIQFFDQQEVSIAFDPYAKHVWTGNVWGASHAPSTMQNTFYFPYGVVIKNEAFDWENDHPLKLPLSHLILYEMHVRGFTQHPSSHVKNPGTFLGVIEKIPHLLSLGVNAVELMPVHEYNELEYARSLVSTKQVLYNYWGYSPVNFFAPMNRFASSSEPGCAGREFKEMVKAFHKNGIEVILDVVFNHTAEGGREGPDYSYRTLDDPAYYILSDEGTYLDFTGCGNTFNTNHPLSLELILNCLRYWVSEMHVDGFRFDLASIFCRNLEGVPVPQSAILEAISRDSILADTKLIAEPWDAAGLYQVGAFSPSIPRWAEWNGRYRDILRRFIRGVPGSKGEFATRFCGSEDLYKISGRTPAHSVNFVTVHDGFTLTDVVSYNRKHNLDNGEDNRDGMNENESWNCGTEGPTDELAVLSLRERQKRNLLLTLLLSQGVPLLFMGDEYGHTKKGNNNTWCQDNDLNWFLWDELTKAPFWFRFCKNLIQLRTQHPFFKRAHFLTPQDVTWHGLLPYKANWSQDSRFIAMTLNDPSQLQHEIYIAINTNSKIASLTLPPSPEGTKWILLINTASPPPQDFYDDTKAPFIETKTLTMAPHSALLLIAKEPMRFPAGL